MIKRTLYFGNPSYLSLKQNQLVLRLPEVEKNDTLPESFRKEAHATIPVEDIGVVVLDHQQITITQGLLDALLENNCAIITCDKQRLPVGLMLPLCGNSTQTERFRYQLQASLPLQKQLWQQTIIAKIENQAAVLRDVRGLNVVNMQRWALEVRSGDAMNLEARAAAYYWKEAFPMVEDFKRDRDGIAPNNMLNYGYAILRAVVARALVGSGLLPTWGMHHRNKYNAYCLADDVMEPYRPFVDRLVMLLYDKYGAVEILEKQHKADLLAVPTLDVIINGKRSPLLVAVGLTTSSLQKCYAGEARKIVYPTM
ncbi:MAG: type II CRISPR-associated endonuclease Cas1 [Paludibacteraceae bacterium]|nr:type II CRISPR-associated endonuclease Cas1 [Paludibacteraceae bacterium]